MSRKAIFATLVVVLVAAVPATVFAGGPAEKATGDVGFDTPWGWVDLTFNAHETDPAKGWVSWYRWDSVWAGPVVSTTVEGNKAWFTVRVIEGNPVVVGCDITFYVEDNGEPGVLDKVDMTAVVHSPSSTCAAYGQTQGPYTIDAGNLQVHTYD